MDRLPGCNFNNFELYMVAVINYHVTYQGYF